MNLTTIHHIAIIVSDYALSKDFYVNKLGLNKIAARWPAKAVASDFFI